MHCNQQNTKAPTKRVYTLLALSLICLLPSSATASNFTNSLGMRFVEVPDIGPKFCIHPTRVSDYRVFVQATGRHWPPAPFAQGADHPAVNVNWDDANLFCEWLTEREARAGTLPVGARYRLPTDGEWVAAATPPGVTVGEEMVFVWGTQWPPPKGAANLSPELQIDSYATTSPVMKHLANPHGLYDLAGNTWEWCLDTYEGSPNVRVLRGGSWNVSQPGDLTLLSRIGNRSDLRLPVYGFRIVLDNANPEPVSFRRPLTPWLPPWLTCEGLHRLQESLGIADIQAPAGG